MTVKKVSSNIGVVIMVSENFNNENWFTWTRDISLQSEALPPFQSRATEHRFSSVFVWIQSKHFLARVVNISSWPRMYETCEISNHDSNWDFHLAVIHCILPWVPAELQDCNLGMVNVLQDCIYLQSKIWAQCMTLCQFDDDTIIARARPQRRTTKTPPMFWTLKGWA